MGNMEVVKYHSIKDYPRFGKMTVEMGFITEDQLKTVLNEQLEINLSNRPHQNLGELLLKKGWITLEQVVAVLEKLKREGNNVTAFINAIKRDLRVLISIILAILTTIIVINLRFLSSILNFIPPVSVGALFFILIGLISICIYLSKIIVRNAISELAAYDRKMTGYLASLEKEVKERMRLEKKLVLQSKHDWETAFNAITDMITVHDKDFNIVKANAAAVKLLALPDMEEARDVKCYRYYHGADSPPEGCPGVACIKTEIPTTFELFEPHLHMHIEIRTNARVHEGNDIGGFIHITRDISIHKKIESAVKRAKNEWETTFDNTSEYITLVDSEGRISRCNKSFADFVKIPIKEVIGIPCSELIPIDSEHIKPGMPAVKTEVKTADGKWLYISYCPIHDEDGQFLRGVMVFTDITKMKDAQDKLKESEKQLKNRVVELENFYEMAVNREIRMKELKKEIEKLRSLKDLTE